MVQYKVLLHAATGYKHGHGWVYDGKHIDFQSFASPLHGNALFDKYLPDISIHASEHQAAAKLELIRVDGENEELMRRCVYDGESVFGWKAAFQEYGQTEIEDRFYICTVHAQAGYFAFVHPDNQYPGRKVIGCTHDLEDLKYRLGDEYPLYEIRD